MTTGTQNTAPGTPKHAASMKAAVIHHFGDVDAIQYEDIEKPSVQSGHVLVKVLAAGVNRLDHYIREGRIVPSLPFPHILGADAAGEIAELGGGVSGWNVGERVIVAPGFPQKIEETGIRPTVFAPSFALPGLHISGTYTSYMEVPVHALVKDETGLPPEQVATLPVVLATSVHAIKQIGQVKEGDTVLVQAGASGSGSMHIQVAKALGARVATTIRSDHKADLVRQAGADLVIRSSREDVVEKVKEWTDGNGVDVVIDNLAGDDFVQSIDAAKAGGVVVSYGFAAGTEVRFDIRNLFFGQKQIRGTMASDAEDLEFGLELVRQGTIQPQLDRTLPLSRTAEAHRLIADNQVAGNIVLLPWAE